MRRVGGHVTLTAVIAGLFLTPLLLPYYSVVLDPSALQIWREADRIFVLAQNTACLATLTTIIALPIGIAAAFALNASPSRWRRLSQSLLLVGLAVPLPVTTVAWHALRFGQWSPFSHGLIPAAVLHALAGLPWVVLIVNVGLSSRDPAVSDDARLHAGPIVRCLCVTLPRIRGFVALAAFWVIAQTAGEIVVTDMLQVRTFAEEVYTQAVAPASETNTAAELAVARAVAASLPMPIVFACMFVVIARWLRGQPNLELRSTSEETKQSIAGYFVTLLAISVIATPMACLILRCCRTHEGYSAFSGIGRLAIVGRDHSQLLIDSVIAALSTSFVVTFVVGVVAMCARRNQCFRAILLIVGVLAASIPAPIVGLGVRSAIDGILSCEQRCGLTVFRGVLYDGPSLLPVAWTWAIRSWPLALAIWWPAIVRLPRDFAEATRMDTGNAWAILRYDVLPTMWRPLATSIALIAAFCLGEVSASRLVTTPGGQSFTHDVFARMHFGITPDLAAMCLVLVVVIGVCCVAIRN